jgi:hypothetical protein
VYPITYFSHSTYSATHLDAPHVVYAINEGLERTGKIRFATIYRAGYALLRTLPPIVELVQTGIIDVDAEKGCILS